MIKKILFLIVLIQLVVINNTVSSEIIPIKKPSQTPEETKKKLLIDVLKPLPKPIKVVEKENVDEKVVKENTDKIDFILPKKKPLVAGSKKVKDIKISKFYSQQIYLSNFFALILLYLARYLVYLNHLIVLPNI